MWFTRKSVPDHVPSPDQPRQLALYKYDSCPFCVRVLRKLQQLEVEVELRDTRSQPEHRRHLQEQTGRTQVPCLFIDEQPLFESADIITWLEAYAARAEA